MEAKNPGATIWVAGFSFGAAVALRSGCADESVRALIAVGAPVSKYDLPEARSCAKPKLFVQGELDEFGSPGDLKRFVDSVQGRNELKIIDGADHFFEGHLPELYETVSSFIAEVEQFS
jgi:alpha/beta superfamily hydrolase